MRFVARPVVAKIIVGVVFAGAAIVGVGSPAFATSCPVTTPVLQSDIANGADYTVCNFDNFSFAGLTGDSINFSITHLTNTSFSGATFSNSNFGNASGGGQDFRAAAMTTSSFNFAGLSGSQMNSSTSFAGSSLHYTELSDVSGAGADFTGADLYNARLYRSNFVGANFTNAIFTDVLFVNVFNLVGPDLSGANLTGATGLTSLNLADATLSPTTICPDGVVLGAHAGDCFSPFAALIPTFDSPVATVDGFTVNVTNYSGAYGFSASILSGAGVVSVGTASGAMLPLRVTGLGVGATATVRVDTSIGSLGSPVTAFGTVSGAALIESALASTGVNALPPLVMAALFLGAGVGLRLRPGARRFKRARLY
jgi:uncharacterized protein YjbI with pentapeptide repeats